MKYKLLTNPNKNEFEKTINSMLCDDWKLFGNTFIIVDNIQDEGETFKVQLFCQALVKEN